MQPQGEATASARSRAKASATLLSAGGLDDGVEEERTMEIDEGEGDDGRDGTGGDGGEGSVGGGGGARWSSHHHSTGVMEGQGYQGADF